MANLTATILVILVIIIVFYLLLSNTQTSSNNNVDENQSKPILYGGLLATIGCVAIYAYRRYSGGNDSESSQSDSESSQSDLDEDPYADYTCEICGVEWDRTLYSNYCGCECRCHDYGGDPKRWPKYNPLDSGANQFCQCGQGTVECEHYCTCPMNSAECLRDVSDDQMSHYCICLHHKPSKCRADDGKDTHDCSCEKFPHKCLSDYGIRKDERIKEGVRTHGDRFVRTEKGQQYLLDLKKMAQAKAERARKEAQAEEERIRKIAEAEALRIREKEARRAERRAARKKSEKEKAAAKAARDAAAKARADKRAERTAAAKRRADDAEREAAAATQDVAATKRGFLSKLFG